MTVRSNTIIPDILNVERQPSKYTFIVDESSYMYLLLMRNLPYFIYSLHLKGYEFAGINNTNTQQAPGAIVVGMVYDKYFYYTTTSFGGYNFLTNTAYQYSNTSAYVKSVRRISLIAFDNKTQERIWQTDLSGSGGKIDTNEYFEIPAILYMGAPFIAYDGSYKVTDFGSIEKYNEYVKNSVSYYNMLAVNNVNYPVINNYHVFKTYEGMEKSYSPDGFKDFYDMKRSTQEIIKDPKIKTQQNSKGSNRKVGVRRNK